MSLRLRRLVLIVLVPSILDVMLLVVLRQRLGVALVAANLFAVAVAGLVSYVVHREATLPSDPYLRYAYMPTVFAGVTVAAAGVDTGVLLALEDRTTPDAARGLLGAKVAALACGAVVRLGVNRLILFSRVSRARRQRTVRPAAPGTVRLSVVVPAYNEADRIADTVKALHEALAEVADRGGVEVLVVDDGSVDDTGDAATVAGADQVITHRVNRGKGAAVRTGVLAAQGRTVVFTDADLAYSPSQILPILGAVEAGWDMAIGNRRHPETETLMAAPFLREVGSRVVNLFVRMVLLGDLRDTQSGLKGCRSDVGRFAFSRAHVDGFAFDVEMLHIAERQGFSVTDVPVAVTNSDRSTVRPGSDFARLLRDILRIRHLSATGAYEARGRPLSAAPGYAAAVAEPETV